MSKRVDSLILIAILVLAVGLVWVISTTLEAKITNAGDTAPDFKITEDGIVQKLSTFAEGDRPAMEVGEGGALKPLSPRRTADKEV